jgi:dTDP-4-amino-4,6-dideoxygalactose transaminase
VTDSFIPFHRPSIGAREQEAVRKVLESGWLTTGERTRRFEKRFASVVGARHAVAVNSATAALHLALEAIGVREGHEVVLPTYTFAASGEVAMYLGARAVLVDIAESTMNMAPGAVEAAITPRIKVFEILNFGGLPADLQAIEASTRRGAMRVGIAEPAVVEDAAHAFPSRIAGLNGRYAGTIGKAGAFSFYATKTITTGEGGMLVTDDDRIADRARVMRLHGISRDAWKRYATGGSWYYEIEEPGYKDNPTDISSALGLGQLARANAFRRARARIARRYLDELSDLDRAGALRLPERGEGDEHAWHLFVIRLDEQSSDEIDLTRPGVAGLPASLRSLATARARAIETITAAGVGSSVHFIPLHLHPLYRRLGYGPGDFPVSERAYAGAISLPIWPGLTDAMQARVIRAVRTAILS